MAPAPNFEQVTYPRIIEFSYAMLVIEAFLGEQACDEFL
jgi:hypothetical protein